MAIANLHETLLFYTQNKARLIDEMDRLQHERTNALYSQGDVRSIKAQDEQEIKNFYKALYDDSEEYQGKYKDYTEIPDFEDEIEKINAKYQEQLEQLTAWETQLEAQITTNSAELEETNAYIESIKSMLQSNIQEDYNYGLSS